MTIAVRIFIKSKTCYLIIVPVGKFRFCPISNATCTSVVAGISLTNGLSVNGAVLLSGTGSILITAVPPWSSTGKDKPLGALTKKSSPGNGGPGLLPL